MNSWNTSICETNGIKIHYTKTGEGKPTLVLLHGLIANGLCWAEVANKLENEYSIIMPDARGHGKSAIPDYGYSYYDHANDVIGLINSLNLAEPPILLGHSMGGLVATVIAGYNPKIISGLILADPTFINIKTQREVRDSDVSYQHRQHLNKSYEELVSDLKNRHPKRSLEIIDKLAQARLQTSMAAFDVLTPPNPDYLELVKKIDVPGLLVFGDKGIVTSKIAQEIQIINPKFQIEQIPDVGHGLLLD